MREQQSQQTGDQWQEQGAWLLLLVLPLMLSYFRRGSVILMLPFTCLPLLFLLSFSVISPAAFAASSISEDKNAQPNEQVQIPQVSTPQESTLTQTSQKIWQNLWQTNDQQAQKQYNQKNYQGAAQQFENSQWQGSAHYKAGNYQEALDAFTQGEQATTANSLYNQGNALAQMQQYEKAIESYEQALKKNPDLQDAKDNIEKIKQQQKKQEQKQEQQKGDQSNDDQSQEDQSSEKNEQQKDSQSQDKQSQDKQDQQNQQQSDNSQDQQKDSSDESQKSDEQKQNKPQDSNKEQSDKEAEEKRQEQQQKNVEQAEKDGEKNEQKTAAQIAKEQQAKETEQKHQQLLNKVTDDPYLLLRNKMQLEYQKRQQDGSSPGVKKKW